MRTSSKVSSIILSLCEAIIGILLLVNPIGFTTGIIVFLGIVLLILGITSVEQSLFCILCNPFSSTAVLWMFIAIILIVEAIVDIIAAIFAKEEKL